MSGERTRGRHARVTITSQPLWRVRLAREAPRYLVCAASVAGLAASARFAIAPPRVTGATPTATAGDRQDLAAQGFAVLFVRRYLSWSAARPAGAESPLSNFAGSLEPDAGFVAPARGEQHVEWAEVVQSRTPAAGEHVYTIAAQTDSAGLLYLSVAVTRDAHGALSLAGYPSFVGAPSNAPAGSPPRLREVADRALTTVVTRALRNYLADLPGELAADLTSDARVSLPSLSLVLDRVASTRWEPDGMSLDAVVETHDGRGAQYVLAYELDVALRQGRWEVSAIQTDPTS
jgi:hypothetical protein